LHGIPHPEPLGVLLWAFAARAPLGRQNLWGVRVGIDLLFEERDTALPKRYSLFQGGICIYRDHELDI
jgi:hypothetical protein